MPGAFPTLVLALLAVAVPLTEPDRTAPEPCRYVGGRWWDGEAFVERVVHVEAGRFVDAPSEPVSCEVDLAGRWIIPPYGDAHRHDLADSATLDEQVATYLERGVFYAMEQDPIHAVGPAIRERVNRPESVDVVYTQGVVGPSWGFIADFYRSLVGQGEFGERTFEEVEGREIFVVDDRRDLEAKWPAIEARNEAFVKVILAFSEQFERRRSEAFLSDPPGPSASAGLDPALLPELVRRAHEAGLRVSVHIETAHDFRVAVDADADVIAHLPASWQLGPPTGFPEGEADPWLLEPADARAAAERGTIVVTTIQRGDAEPRGDLADEIHRHNLALLREHGATVAIGSDGFEPVILAPGEALYLHRLGVYDVRELLEMLTFTTPRAIFPDRPIGRLATGHEASFLALEGDPLEDLENLRRIESRVKEGRRLDP